MRILFVMEFHPADLPGGAQSQVFQVASELARRGHSVAYLCHRYDSGQPERQVVAGVLVMRELRWRKALRLASTFQLMRHMRRLRPDLVYQRSVTPLSGATGFAASMTKTPFVWACSEDASLESGFLARAQGKTGPARSCGDMAKRLVLRLDAMSGDVAFRHVLRTANAVVAQNKTQAQLFRQHHKRQAVVIPNGVRKRAYERSEAPAPLVLWLNRLTVGKNAEAFLRLAERLEGSLEGIQFVLVGGRARDGYWEELRKRGSQVHALTLTGHVPYDETWAWFEAAWVYVLTSHGEGFPNVMLQAWASGTPIVSLSVDPDGLLQDEGLGVVAGTEDRLAEVVLNLLRQEDQRRRLSARGRECVEKRFDIELVANRYEELFHRVSSRARSGDGRI